ncbi:MAG TPA: alkene reductase [Xanthobacteraceae bacterium]|nr:alkene reductase [Xanthobacteraceae bacterium]
MNVQTANPGNSPPQMEPLLSPYQNGALSLANRMVMAPMTRNRASADGVPHPLAKVYYAQRASAGLIVTEATYASPGGGAYHTPGLMTPAQISAWKEVTDAVHAAGGKIFVQLWHTGRTSHPDLRGGQLPVAPSAIICEGEARVSETERKPRVAPHPLTIPEIKTIVAEYRAAATNAIAAGFDGIELHGANGYLIDQFTRDGSNQRTDEYGGSIENRARFGLEIARACSEAIGASRIGYRVSPTSPFNAMSDSDPIATFSYLASELSKLGIAYLHVIDPVDAGSARITPVLRKAFRGTYIVCGAFNRITGEAIIAAGDADLVAFGVPFLANPDLPLRYTLAAQTNEPRRDTFYSSGIEGYTDYPKLSL